MLAAIIHRTIGNRKNLFDLDEKIRYSTESFFRRHISKPISVCEMGLRVFIIPPDSRKQTYFVAVAKVYCIKTFRLSTRHGVAPLRSVRENMSSRLRKDLAGASKPNRSLIREKRNKGKDKKAENLRNRKKKKKSESGRKPRERKQEIK